MGVGEVWLGEGDGLGEGGTGVSDGEGDGFAVGSGEFVVDGLRLGTGVVVGLCIGVDVGKLVGLDDGSWDWGGDRERLFGLGTGLSKSAALGPR